MKKGDFFLLAAVLLLAGVLAVSPLLKKDAGSVVVVKVDNEETCRLPLDTDTVLTLSGNTVTISGGKVQVSEADCPDRLCVHHAAISKMGETIVCLPHRLVLEVQ